MAGLDENDVPFISGMDLIGAPVFAKDFVLAGTATDAMFGTCTDRLVLADVIVPFILLRCCKGVLVFSQLGMAESLWRPDMNPDELFECISQALLNAFDRDATSGWGAVVHLMYELKRMRIDCSMDS